MNMALIVVQLNGAKWVEKLENLFNNVTPSVHRGPELANKLIVFKKDIFLKLGMFTEKTMAENQRVVLEIIGFEWRQEFFSFCYS